MNQSFVAVFSENVEITPPSGPFPRNLYLLYIIKKNLLYQIYCFYPGSTRKSVMKMKNESQMKSECSMDGGCFILQPEADNSLTKMINIWYFSLEKHSEQVILMI